MTALATSADWASEISARWQSSRDAILEVGRLLMAAKEALPHGTFSAMIEGELPFGSRTAQMLMRIAGDVRIANAKHASLLPTSYSDLYDLTKLTDDQFEARIEDGTIKPDMGRNAIRTEVKKSQRQSRERLLGVVQTSLPTKKYGVIVADPEWRFEPWSRQTGMDRAADNHYPTSCLDVIKARDVPSIAAKDCVLFLWATVPMLPHGLAVMAAWGFDYRSHMVWAKDRAGTGYWFRNQHELLLVGVTGNIPAPAPGTQFSSVLGAPLQQHSAKPQPFLAMVERYFPTLPKIELNRRGPARPGWDAWGNEATEEIDPVPDQPPSEFDDPDYIPPFNEWRTPLA